METIPQAEQKKMLQVELPLSLLRHIRLEAARRDTTIRALVTEAVKAYIGEPEQEEAA